MPVYYLSITLEVVIFPSSRAFSFWSFRRFRLAPPALLGLGLQAACLVFFFFFQLGSGEATAL